MTSNSRRRGYPGPASPRERGNGGLDTELLARAVAADLDVLDAAWPKQAQKNTKILGLTGTQTGCIASNENFINFNALEAEILGGDQGFYAGVAQQLGVLPGGEGWYHVTAGLCVQPSAAVTASALSRMVLKVQKSGGPSVIDLETYFADAQNDGTSNVPICMNTEFVTWFDRNITATMYYFHLNAASDMNALAAGTYLSGTKICGVV